MSAADNTIPSKISLSTTSEFELSEPAASLEGSAVEVDVPPATYPPKVDDNVSTREKSDGSLLNEENAFKNASREGLEQTYGDIRRGEDGSDKLSLLKDSDGNNQPPASPYPTSRTLSLEVQPQDPIRHLDPAGMTSDAFDARRRVRMDDNVQYIPPEDTDSSVSIKGSQMPIPLNDPLPPVIHQAGSGSPGVTGNRYTPPWKSSSQGSTPSSHIPQHRYQSTISPPESRYVTPQSQYASPLSRYATPVSQYATPLSHITRMSPYTTPQSRVLPWTYTPQSSQRHPPIEQSSPHRHRPSAPLEASSFINNNPFRPSISQSINNIQRPEELTFDDISVYPDESAPAKTFYPIEDTPYSYAQSIASPGPPQAQRWSTPTPYIPPVIPDFPQMVPQHISPPEHLQRIPVSQTSNTQEAIPDAFVDLRYFPPGFVPLEFIPQKSPVQLPPGFVPEHNSVGVIPDTAQPEVPLDGPAAYSHQFQPYYHGSPPNQVLTYSVGNPFDPSKKYNDAWQYFVVFFLDVLPGQIYLHFLLRLPSLYFSRVARVFEEADLSLPEIKKMALETASTPNSTPFDFYTGYETLPSLPPAYLSFKKTWETFIDSVMREWKTFNIISVLLLSAILTILQIDAAFADPVTRYSAMASLICALISLLYGCMYIIRFGGMKKTFKAAEWALEAKKSRTFIWWNVWVLLAMPAIWLTWSIILYVVCIMSFIWRTGSSTTEVAISSAVTLSLRITISSVLFLGLIYGVLILGTFRRYGDAMDNRWKKRIHEWLIESHRRKLGIPDVILPEFPPADWPMFTKASGILAGKPADAFGLHGRDVSLADAMPVKFPPGDLPSSIQANGILVGELADALGLHGHDGPPTSATPAKFPPAADLPSSITPAGVTTVQLKGEVKGAWGPKGDGDNSGPPIGSVGGNRPMGSNAGGNRSSRSLRSLLRSVLRLPRRPSASSYPLDDRSAPFVDTVGPFMIGDSYGPILEPFFIKIAGIQIKINPLLQPLTQDDKHQPHLNWNMLTLPQFAKLSTDSDDDPWIKGRDEPATFPRITSLFIISDTVAFPWQIEVKARNSDVGVVCGDIIDTLGAELNKLTSETDYNLVPKTQQQQISEAYEHNRSRAYDVPGGQLGEGMKRLDWLRQYSPNDI